MTVEDPEGIAEGDDIADIREAIADFAAWSGREGVCVPGVEVVSSATAEWEDARGVYRGPHRPILVEPGATWSITMHELCHGLDYEEDIARRYVHRFDTTTIGPADMYDTDELRLAEAFARTCQDGPQAASLSRRITEVCETSSPAADLMRDVVWTAFEDAPLHLGDPLAIDRVALPDLSEALPGIDDAAVTADEILLGSFVWPESDLGRVPKILRFDPALGRVTGSYSIPLAKAGSYVVFVSSDTDPVAVLWGDAPRLVVLDPSTGIAGSAAVPGWENDALLDTYGGLWQADRVWSSWERLGWVDRASGAVFEVELPEPRPWGAMAAPDAAGGVVRVARHSGSATQAYLVWDEETGVFEPMATPNGCCDQLLPLPDGRLLGLQRTSTGFSVLLRDVDGAWSLVHAPCDAPGFQPYDLGLLGGRPWAVGHEDDGGFAAWGLDP